VGVSIRAFAFDARDAECCEAEAIQSAWIASSLPLLAMTTRACLSLIEPSPPSHTLPLEGGGLGWGCGVAAYSTVTDFARLRGWSTSVPLWTAT
jgi:hypothetical protein